MRTGAPAAGRQAAGRNGQRTFPQPSQTMEARTWMSWRGVKHGGSWRCHGEGAGTAEFRPWALEQERWPQRTGRESTRRPAEQEAIRASAQRRGAMAFTRLPGCKTIGCPATLGYVHRLIGPAEQGAFMHSMIGAQRNANAGLNAQVPCHAGQRLRKRRQHFLRHGLWGFAQANPLQQHHEFIATEPCHRVAAAYASIRRLATPRATGRPSVCPRGVVHFLEAVRSMKEQNKLRLLAVGTGHRS